MLVLWRILACVLALILIGPGSEAAAQVAPAPSLFTAAPARGPANEMLGLSPETVGAVAYVTLSPAIATMLRARSRAPERLAITLPGGSVTCAFHAHPRPRGMLLLEGTAIGDEPDSRCNLVVDRGQVTGEIDIASGRHEIVPLGPGPTHAVVELKTEAFPDEVDTEVDADEPIHRIWPANTPLCDVKPQPGQRPKAFGPLKVMIVYTPAARASSPNILADIELIVNQTRQALSLQRTGGNFSIAVELVHAEEISYVESDVTTDRDRLLGGHDPVFRMVHALRDRYRADVVHMLVKKDRSRRDHCGIAKSNPSLRSELAFSVSDRECALHSYAAVHEIGHSLGLEHDRYVAREDRQHPGDFNFGYVALEQRFNTVMAYSRQCRDRGVKCLPVLYFSSPNILHKGVPIGRPLSDPDAAYNLEQLCRAAPIATRFR